ncbi:hypothetical protein ABVK25_006911 [Lepraria finkii]|uniref:Uncharacterized protein n=1 Tax=Lepraria finkii TaxID=1340010 RepID=A0ABR4B6M2_9LECA
MPSSASSAAVALIRPAASSVIAFPNAPPQPAVCAQSLRQVNSDECNAAIAMLPRDPPGRPVARNFYTKVSDISRTTPNQLLPLEKTSGNIHSKLLANNNTHTDENPGGCRAQMLLTTDFSSIPNDVSSYMNLIGPARMILRDCVRKKE